MPRRVNTYKYLGSHATEDGGMDADVIEVIV